MASPPPTEVRRSAPPHEGPEESAIIRNGQSLAGETKRLVDGAMNLAEHDADTVRGSPHRRHVRDELGRPLERVEPGGVADVDRRARGCLRRQRRQIYVASTFGNNSIIRMDDMTGANWTSVGTTGSGAPQFEAPKDVFVDGAGRICVTDSFNYRIVRMDDMSGKNWTTFGTGGTGVNEFSVPTSIFVDATRTSTPPTATSRTHSTGSFGSTT